jgi:hypothetical protein
LYAYDLIVSAGFVEYKRAIDALGGNGDDLRVKPKVKEGKPLACAGLLASGVLDDVVARLAFEIGNT